jgi:hypothetical protein
MPRFLLVKGKPGLLVANPYALDANPSRFCGMRMKLDELKPGAEYVDHFEPCEEMLLEHADILSCLKKGELELVAKVVANTHDEARASLAAKPKKGGDK